MRLLLLALMFAPLLSAAQDPATFARAVHSGKVNKVDRWMQRELHRRREGQRVTTPSASYVVHDPTFDTLVSFLRTQSGVIDAAWDKCVMKLDLWPGHSTIGLRVQLNGVVHERCYALQEGRPGQLRLFGWRPHVRKDRQTLKFLKVRECMGFVEEQRGLCAE